MSTLHMLCVETVQRTLIFTGEIRSSPFNVVVYWQIMERAGSEKQISSLYV